MKLKNLFWGLFFIVASCLVIVNQLGYLTGINVFSLIATIFLVAIIIKSATHLNFAGVLFSFAFLGILYAEPLGIQNLVPWPILAAALFASIGLSIIFHKSILRHHSHCYEEVDFNKEHFDQIINTPDDNTVACKVSFGSAIKYVNTNNFEKAFFDCSFGAMKIYFDGAQIQGEQAEIFLNTSFSGVEIYLPRNWKVIDNINSSLAGVEVIDRSLNPDKTIILKGKASFSGVDIKYL